MAEGALHLVQVSDIHMTAAAGEAFVGVDPEATLRRVFDHAGRGAWPPAAVLATGDLVADGSVAAYRRLKPHLAGLGVPVFVLPGNHDDPGLMVRHLVSGPVRSEPLWSAAPWRILFLDSSIPGQAHGYLGPERLAALERALAQHTARPTLIAVHHNPVAIGSTGDYCPLADGAALFDVIDRHDQVRGLTWGHVHCAFDAFRRDVRLMATPSSAVQLPIQPGSLATIEDAPGYRTITLHPDGRIDSRVHWAQA